MHITTTNNCCENLRLFEGLNAIDQRNVKTL